MKRLKEIFGKVGQALTGMHKPKTLEEAQDAIVKDSSYISTMKKWATTVGIAAVSMVAIGVLAKMGLILAPALAVGALYGVVQGGIALIKRDLRHNRVAEAEFIEAANAPTIEAPEPGAKPGVKLGPAFDAKAQVPAANENADRIRALEQQLGQLEIQAEAKRKARELGLAG